MKHWTKYALTKTGSHGPKDNRQSHTGLQDLAQRDGQLGQEAQKELTRRNKKRSRKQP
jgi:hypothetical protein